MPFISLHLHSKQFGTFAKKGLSALVIGSALLGGCQRSGDLTDSKSDGKSNRNELAVGAATVPSQFNDVQIANGLTNPTAMEFSPDGRIFICQQGGAVRVFKNGALLPTPFLTLAVDQQSERGLLGIAFDPNFAIDKYVYVFYTPAGLGNNRISRFRVSDTNPDLVQPGSELTILNISPNTGVTHNGGAMHFGLDGKLYIAVGDNATSSNAQSMSNLHGKMLRINKDGTIPSDNPFFNTASGDNRAIWTLGHRNPFPFAVQPGTGRIFENDVGEAATEEVNEITRGANYGWPSSSNSTAPFYQYAWNSASNCAIIGAAFYNPSVQNFPATYVGKYMFGDWCGGYIKMLDLGTRTTTDFATGISGLTDIKVGPNGEVFYVTFGGSLNRISYTGVLAPSIATHPTAKLVSVGYTAKFAVQANGAAPLSYQWQRNGVNISGATLDSLIISNAQMSDHGASFRCVVTNSAGSVTSNAATLSVTTNLPPSASILTPTTGQLYAAATTLNFSGSGSDPETGALPASSFTWKIDFHHGTHTHPVMNATQGITSGSFVISDRGETSSDVWLRVYLTVTDGIGLTTETYRDVLPIKATVTLIASPKGLNLELDGVARPGFSAFEGVAGVIRTLSAPSPQTADGITYTFRSWSNGQAATHELATPASDGTISATFVAVGAQTSLPGRLHAEEYKNGGEGVGYHDLSAVNEGTAFYRNDNVDLEPTGDIGGGYNVGWIQAGEWLEYDVNVTRAGLYTITARMASGLTGTKTATLTVDGGPTVATFNLTEAPGWQTYRNISVANVNLTAGPHVLRLNMQTNFMNINYLDFTTNANQVPVANAGIDLNRNVNTTVTLDGRLSSDPDNGPQPLTYSWAFVSGPTSVTLTNGTSSQPSFTPSLAGTYTFRLTVNDGALTSSDDVIVAVTSSATNISLPGRIEAENYKAGGQGVGFNDLTPANEGNASQYTGVDVETTGDVGGGYNVGWTGATEWLAYNVNVATSGAYTLTARMASGLSGNKSATVTVDGITVATFTFADFFGWQSYRNYSMSGVNLTAGVHEVRINFQSAYININYLDVTASVNQGPTANAGADLNRTVNTSVTLDGRGSSDPDNAPQPLTYSWALASGPSSVTLANATTSQPSFSPSAIGTYNFQLTVSDGAQTSVDNVAITVVSGVAYINLPGRIQAESYAPGDGIGYYDTDVGNTGGAFRSDNVDIEATSDVGGGFNVGWIATGEWLQYDVNVATTRAYTLTARMASGVSGTKTAQVRVDGVLVGTFNFTNPTGWSNWTNVTLPSVNLSAGIHVIRITMVSDYFNLNYLDVQ